MAFVIEESALTFSNNIIKNTDFDDNLFFFNKEIKLKFKNNLIINNNFE